MAKATHERDAMAAPHFDVAVIGYGPVGAMLANLLGISGLSVVVLEREASVYHLPRAVSADGEALRLFQTIGLAGELLPRLNTSRNIRHVNAQGQLLLLLTRAGIGPEGWNNAYRFFQPELESILRAGVARFPQVDVRLRADVFALDEGADHVRVRYENLTSGALDAVTARYVVGCDGARSTVRRFMGAALQDLRSHERWIVIDMVLESPPAGVPEAHDENGVVVDAIQYCDPARPTTFIPMPGKRHRWEFMLMPQDDPATITRAENVYALLAPWKIEPETSEIERAVVYTFHSALATRWRRERLLLAGDSAHQTPPFLGQGMCSGLRDVANLAWKLRDVISGRAPDALLDTYQSERMEHVRAFIELAVELGGVIQTTDLEKARQRDRDLVANPTMIRPIMPRLGPGLQGDAPAPAGARAAQPRLAEGRRLDDHVGYRFALLATARLLEALPGRLRKQLDDLDIVVVTASGEASDYLAGLGDDGVVIRPDRYILGVASTPEGLESVVGRIPHVAANAAGIQPVRSAEKIRGHA
jgi:3-(3-hydroxy-phenyl)propionate hydroxylase